jgi:hypothetical protein
MRSLLIVLAFILLLVSVLFINEATLGVGLIGAACFLGILARLVQAAEHQAQLLDALAKMQDRLDSH